MGGQLKFWRTEIDRNPAVAFVIAVFLAEMYMNAATGYRLANESYVAGVIWASIAVWAAYCGTIAPVLQGQPGRKALLIASLIFGIGMGQYAAWQTLGLRFADGQIVRETKAVGVVSAKETLDAKRAERKAIGTLRPIGTIEADLDLELRRTSKQYPAGDGPKATKLKGELAAAKRGHALDTEIKTALVELEGRDQVSGGAPQFQVAQTLAQSVSTFLYGKKAGTVTTDDVLFATQILIAAGVGLIANLGFWLCGVGHDVPPPRRSEDDDDGGDDGSGARLRQALDALPQLPPRQRALPSPAYAGGPSAGGSANAPITINVGGVPHGQQGGGGQQPVNGEVLPPPAAARGERHDLRAIEALPYPIDRSGVRRDLSDDERPAADVMLAFRRACVIDTPGGVVAMDRLDKRYRHWAGARAVSPETFRVLFPQLTGVQIAEIGGFAHAVNVALRVGRVLRAAS